MPKANGGNRYERLIEKVFFDGWRRGIREFEFAREELETAAAELGIKLPKNLGDVIYNQRYRSELPDKIRKTAKEGHHWIIVGAGRARYRFCQTVLNRIVPRTDLVAIKVPDATPEIIARYALGDEQALLAKVRYNRLIDIFLGLATYSLQNHLRTSVEGIGQIEIDEIYVGLNRNGAQFVIPVQAKGGRDKHGPMQTQQDIAGCRRHFPNLVCRPVSAQFMPNKVIALFELAVVDGAVKVLEERHYQLVDAEKIATAELKSYQDRG